MKIFQLVLAVLFAGFGFLQFNDQPTDIWYWVVVYFGVAAISAFAAFGKYNMYVIILGLAAVVFELFRKFPTIAQWFGDGMPNIVDEMQATSPHIEIVREFFGLVLCFVVLVFQYIRYVRWRNRQIETQELP